MNALEQEASMSKQAIGLVLAVAVLLCATRPAALVAQSESIDDANISALVTALQDHLVDGAVYAMRAEGNPQRAAFWIDRPTRAPQHKAARLRNLLAGALEVPVMSKADLITCEQDSPPSGCLPVDGYDGVLTLDLVERSGTEVEVYVGVTTVLEAGSIDSRDFLARFARVRGQWVLAEFLEVGRY